MSPARSEWPENWPGSSPRASTCRFTMSATERQLEARARLEAEGLVTREFAVGMADALREFRAAVGQPTWFEGWEEGAKPAEGALAATFGERIVGFCEYRRQGEAGDFGPLAVLNEYRERGIGGALLLEAMLRLKGVGTRRSDARWVWPLRLYEKNGWAVCRRYAVLERVL